MLSEDDIVYRLRKRAQIRREAKDRLSVKENKPDRLANLLNEAADEIGLLREQCDLYVAIIKSKG